jgi:hypothetical protein
MRRQVRWVGFTLHLLVIVQPFWKTKAFDLMELLLFRDSRCQSHRIFIPWSALLLWRAYPITASPLRSISGDLPLLVAKLNRIELRDFATLAG